MTAKPYKYDKDDARESQRVSEPAVSYAASRSAASLKLEAIDELMNIFDTDRLSRAVDFLRTLGREEEDLMPGGIPALQFTKEELIAELRQSEEDRQAGRFRSSEEVFGSLEQKYPFLCE